jgi:hypothetical protein
MAWIYRGIRWGRCQPWLALLRHRAERVPTKVGIYQATVGHSRRTSTGTPVEDGDTRLQQATAALEMLLRGLKSAG